MARRAIGPTAPHDEIVVLCAGTSWDGPTGSDKQLAKHLRDFVPVVYVDPPMSVLTPLKRPELRGRLLGPRLIPLDKNLLRLTPLSLPGVTRVGLREIARLSTRRAIRRAVRQMDADVRGVIIASLDNLFGTAGETRRVLWGTDDFAAAGELMGLSDSWLAEQERDQLARANQIVAVSEPLADKWRAMGYEVRVIPNGCDSEHYRDLTSAPDPVDVVLPRPIAGFVGHMSDRIDLDYLEAVAETGISLLLVGPRQATFEISRLDALVSRDNVQWVGAKAFEELPSYLKMMSVGLTPYRQSTFNDASFPLKTLEYLAAGLPAISTDLPAVRWLDTDLITVADTPTAFAAATQVAAREEDDDRRSELRRDFAAENSWAARAADFARLLGLTEQKFVAAEQAAVTGET